MFQELEKVEERFEELTRLFSDPLLPKNPNEFKKISKERSDLEQIVNVFRTYKKIKQDLVDNKKIIAEEDDKEMRSLAEEEIAPLQEKLNKLEEELKVLLLPKDPMDEKNVMLEIRAGTGGDEAALFASDLFRMYQRYAESKGWKIEILSHSTTGLGGTKEIIASIDGDKVYSHLKFESGVHRVQRVPKTEASGRIHTSACTVAIMPEADEIDIRIEEKDLEIDVFRSGGPGGQGVNTTDSAVRVTHKPTGLVVVCQDERSQHKNKAKAIKILRSRLYDMEQQRQQDEQTKTRRTLVGSGDRSEKIRTYNFPQNRITDHRIGLTIHRLIQIMEGDLDEMLENLRTYFQAKLLNKS